MHIYLFVLCGFFKIDITNNTPRIPLTLQGGATGRRGSGATTDSVSPLDRGGMQRQRHRGQAAGTARF